MLHMLYDLAFTVSARSTVGFGLYSQFIFSHSYPHGRIRPAFSFDPFTLLSKEDKLFVIASSTILIIFVRPRQLWYVRLLHRGWHNYNTTRNHPIRRPVPALCMIRRRRHPSAESGNITNRRCCWESCGNRCRWHPSSRMGCLQCVTLAHAVPVWLTPQIATGELPEIGCGRPFHSLPLSFLCFLLS